MRQLWVGCWVLVAACGGGQAPASDPSKSEAAAVPSAGSQAPQPLVAAGAASCDRALFDDLEDNDTRVAQTDGRGGFWFTYKDNSGSVVAPAGFSPAEGGAGDSKYAAHFSGKTATGEMIYVGMGFGITHPEALYDLSKGNGVCFEAKGKGPVRFRLSDVNTTPSGGVCKNCYNDFGADFELEPEWKKYCFKFDELKQQPDWGEPQPAVMQDKVFSMGWQIWRTAVDFDAWIDNVTLSCE